MLSFLPQQSCYNKHLMEIRPCVQKHALTCSMYEAVGSSGSISLDISCCRKVMTCWASCLKRSRPTAMPTREMHSSALARSSRCCLSCGLDIGVVRSTACNKGEADCLELLATAATHPLFTTATSSATTSLRTQSSPASTCAKCAGHYGTSASCTAEPARTFAPTRIALSSGTT